MKKTINFIAVIFVLFTAVCSANAQTKRRVKSPPKNAVVWETTQINKFGVLSLALPKKFGKGKENNRETQSGEVTTTSFSVNWINRNLKTSETRVDFNLGVTQWNKDFSVVTEIQPEFATPENLLMINHKADLKNMEKNDNPGAIYEEVTLLEIDGQKGSYFRAKYRDNGKTLIGWQTFRYFNSIPQRISMDATCLDKECDSVLEIFKSIKFIK